MREHFLLSRIRLNFDTISDDVHGELSAVAVSPDGSIWIGSDEMISVECLTRQEPHVYGEHRSIPIKNYVELFNLDGEIDIEGMDYAQGYLWITGSHSTKRKKPKGDSAKSALKSLAKVYVEKNRYMLMRIPVFRGELLPSYTHPDYPDAPLTAAWLQKSDDQNILIDALRNDDHLGPYLTFPIPNKENGFDIEGLAVHGKRLFLGFRGPVLRGWAIILEIEVEESTDGVLTLNNIGKADRRYKKHFVHLNGLGVRDLCFKGNDLIILAGPTMDLEGAMEVFRLKDVLELEDDSITDQDDGTLELLFDLPFTIGSDHAEGIALYDCLGETGSLLVVYDSPDPARRPNEHSLFADVFWLR